MYVYTYMYVGAGIEGVVRPRPSPVQRRLVWYCSSEKTLLTLPR